MKIRLIDGLIKPRIEAAVEVRHRPGVGGEIRFRLETELVCWAHK